MTKRRKRSNAAAPRSSRESGPNADDSRKTPPADASSSQTAPRKSATSGASDAGGRSRPGAADPQTETSPVSDSPHPPKGKQILFPQLPSLSRIMSVVMLMFGILAVGVLFYQLMIGFFVPLFLAALLVVIFRPVHLWILEATHHRRRLSAGLTTAMILLVVLIPFGMLVSIATTQFTVLLSQMNGNMSVALNRVRTQLGLNLPHAEHFRELDRIIDQINLDQPAVGDPEVVLPSIEYAAKIKLLGKAAAIVVYLQKEVPGNQSAVEAADNTITNIERFSANLKQAIQIQKEDPNPSETDALLRLNATEQFDQQAVIVAASIRTWMHRKLGGALQSQLKLLANPDETDFARLIRAARDSLQPRFVRLTSATGSILAQILFGLVILIISVYFFLIDGAVMIATLMRLSPMDDEYEHQLLMEFDRTSRAVVLASVLSAVVQGILATLGFWLCGFDQIVLLLFLTTVLALVPFLGAASVWLPCALWLGVVDERWVAAGLLALWGAGVVSSIDNVIKVFVLHGRSQLHPLFALLSVIGGVSVFGPIGILVGPMVVVFLQTLLEILNHELKNEPLPTSPEHPSAALDTKSPFG